MKKRVWGVLCVMVLLVTVILIRPVNDKKGMDIPIQKIVQKDIVSTSEQALKPKLISQKLEADDVEQEFNPYESEAFKAQILQVADLYEESAKYPITSQPITNPEDVKILEPFEETEVDSPYPNENGSGEIRLAAAVDRFQYFFGDSIQLRLQISGAKEGVFTSATAIVAGANGDSPLKAEMNPSDASLTEFKAVFDTSIAPPAFMTPEMLMKVTVTIGDQQLFTTVGFRYSEASAQLVSVSQVRQESAELIIPLQYNVYQDGYYFVRGVLEDANSARPLIQLQTEGRLAQGNAILELRAHISALKSQGSEGPYVLRSVQTYRGAEVGEQFDSPASTSQQRYRVPGYPFSDYEDIPHEDTLTAERIKFLRGLGAVNEDELAEQNQQIGLADELSLSTEVNTAEVQEEKQEIN